MLFLGGSSFNGRHILKLCLDILKFDFLFFSLLEALKKKQREKEKERRKESKRKRKKEKEREKKRKKEKEELERKCERK